MKPQVNTKVFIDIETLPTTDENTIERVISKLKAPGNYKKPEAIEKWIEDNKDEAVKKTSFSGLYGRILCIGYAINDGEAQIITGGENEILTELGIILGKIDSPTFIGHNVREFDIKFIIQRQLINGFKPLFDHKEPYYQRPIIDTMEMFSVNPRDKVSLDNLCYVLNIETPKGELDGSKVYEYWLEGKEQEIYDYCKKDVTATRDVYLKLGGSIGSVNLLKKAS